MRTKSPEGKAAIQAENDFIKFANQSIREIGKEMKNLKRENELRLRNSYINNMIQIMGTNGASQQSIQKALPGLAEFAKYAVRRSAQENIALLEPSQSAPAEEAPGIPLTEV